MWEKTVAKLLVSAAQRLTEAGCDTPRLDAEVLLAHTLGKDRTWLYRYPEYQPNASQQANFAGLMARRESREPVAYLVGHKEFFGLDFLVNKHVLIPRPETELLIEVLLQSVKSQIPNPKSQITMADVGTGSGCIAVSVAKHVPQAKIVAIDTSQRALEIARQNAARHQVSNQITYLRGDLLAPLETAVNIIVSNPPYVKKQHLAAPFTAPEVHQFEPRPALDGGRNGLDVIKRLLAQANRRLSVKGSLLVEIGSDQGQAVKALAQTQFPNADVQIKKDLAGLDRLLVVQK